MNAAAAEELQDRIGVTFPWTVVVVTPNPDGADVVVSAVGEQDRTFKVDDDDLDSPVVRLLVGAQVSP